MARDSDAERERQRKEDEARLRRLNELERKRREREEDDRQKEAMLERAREAQRLQEELDRRYKSQWNLVALTPPRVYSLVINPNNTRGGVSHAANNRKDFC